MRKKKILLILVVVICIVGAIFNLNFNKPLYLSEIIFGDTEEVKTVEVKKLTTYDMKASVLIKGYQDIYRIENVSKKIKVRKDYFFTVFPTNIHGNLGMAFMDGDDNLLKFINILDKNHVSVNGKMYKVIGKKYLKEMYELVDSIID